MSSSQIHKWICASSVSTPLLSLPLTSPGCSMLRVLQVDWVTLSVVSVIQADPPSNAGQIVGRFKLSHQIIKVQEKETFKYNFKAHFIEKSCGTLFRALFAA